MTAKQKMCASNIEGAGDCEKGALYMKKSRITCKNLRMHMMMMKRRMMMKIMMMTCPGTASLLGTALT